MHTNQRDQAAPPIAAEEKELFASIALSPIATVITNPRLTDNPVVATNAAFCALTGYAEVEIVGRNCRFLAGANTEPWLTDRIREAILSRTATLTELLNYRRDGTPFRNAVLVAPIFGPGGNLEYFLGSQIEVDEAGEAVGGRSARARAQIEALSPRQREVLKLMASGQLNKQIAFTLSLSERTIKMHRAALLRALGVETTADAIRLAVEAGF